MVGLARRPVDQDAFELELVEQEPLQLLKYLYELVQAQLGLSKGEERGIGHFIDDGFNLFLLVLVNLLLFHPALLELFRDKCQD